MKKTALTSIISTSLFLTILSCTTPQQPPKVSDLGTRPDTPVQTKFKTSSVADCSIDVHQHFSGNDSFTDASPNMIKLMDDIGVGKGGIQQVILMTPPGSASELGAEASYTEASKNNGASLLKITQDNSKRYALVAGGVILNSTIHKAVVDNPDDPLGKKLSQEAKDKFKADAEKILADGAKGFGEMAALHLSIQASHPFIQIPPNHELFKVLANVAKEKNVPIDIHLEFVAEDNTATPSQCFKTAKDCSTVNGKEVCGQNPSTLAKNIDGFKELLAIGAPIIWSHVGWDNIGHMTLTRLQELLDAHDNLYLSLKAIDSPGPCQKNENSPLEVKVDGENRSWGDLKADWKTFIDKNADKIVMGADEFVTASGSSADSVGLSSTRGTWSILKGLSDETAKKVACDNPKKLFKLN